MSRVTLSGNAPGSIKCPYFDMNQKLRTDSGNDHVLQNFEVFFQWQNKFLSIC